MSLLTLPNITAELPLNDMSFDLRQDALAKWEPEIQAYSNSDNSISIYDEIGGVEGVTVKRISAALRSIGSEEVQVNINSPGGSYFEGIAIYNALIAHPAKVTVNVVGVAASAASIIAMAGDEINIREGAFLMIHNAMTLAFGNRHALSAAAEKLAPFDQAMAGVYSARTGIPIAKVAEMMDKETWIDATQAVCTGFATGQIESENVRCVSACSGKKPLAIIEAALAKAGYSRSERRDTLKEFFSSMPSATVAAMPSAGNETAALLQTLTNTLRGQQS